MLILSLTLLLAIGAAYAWAPRSPGPKHLRHRWIEREINSVIRRSS